MTVWLSFKNADKSHAFSNLEEDNTLVRFTCGVSALSKIVPTDDSDKPHCQQCEKKIKKLLDK